MPHTMLSSKLKGVLGAGLVAAGVAASAGSAHAAVLTVNTASDSGSGNTLRNEIRAANNTPNVADTIRFNIPGANVHTIKLTSPLPVISSEMTFDGYAKQSGAAPATDTAAASIKIVLDANGRPRGLDIAADNVTVKGLAIQNASEDGVYLEGRNDVVQGNHIGTDAAGLVAAPNGSDGVQVDGRADIVGGPDPAERNVISGNSGAQVLLDAGSGHIVQGNRIGTDADGLHALGGGLGFEGVSLFSGGNEVRDNLVSGAATGIEVHSSDNTVQHNDVGTDVNGTAAVANGTGIAVLAGDGNLIGGTGELDGNVVSGNSYTGIELADDDGDAATGNTLQGNVIGTTAEGDTRLANGTNGVWISGSGTNTIGGSTAGAANVIAGNGADGVALVSGANANQVLGNRIGTDLSGTLDLGNGGSGVDIIDSDDNQVGGESDGEANTIAYNDGDGVTVKSSDGGVSGVGNAIVENSIHDDHGLGNDLGGDGTTSNDYGVQDADDGANHLQNGPDIVSATVSSGVDWTLDSGKEKTYRLDFYANASCGSKHVSEGETYLGSRTVTTDANGLKSAGKPFTPATPLTAGQYITVTATQVVAGELRSTSEFSPCRQVQP